GILPFTHLAREGRMTVTIGRRELLAALGGAAAAWPLAARAQQPAAKVRRIGVLRPAGADNSEFQGFVGERGGGKRNQEAAVRDATLIGLFCGALFLNSAAAQSPSGTVRIGILNDQSGSYGDFGGKTSVDAARMAVEDVGGKVLGKSIEIVIGDHQNKPDMASALVRRWFGIVGVSPVAKLTNSTLAVVLLPVAIAPSGI